MVFRAVMKAKYNTPTTATTKYAGMAWRRSANPARATE